MPQYGAQGWPLRGIRTTKFYVTIIEVLKSSTGTSDDEGKLVSPYRSDVFL